MSLSLQSLVFVSSLFVISLSYKMGDTITCWEQNKEDPEGYADPIWSNQNSAECQSADTAHLCDIYQTQGIYAGKGDVCEQDNRNNGAVQNMFYFNVIFGAAVNAEKTWSYKCWVGAFCPLKDANGAARPGCMIRGNRITCCCNDADYCNGQELYRQYAEWGRDDSLHYPPDLVEILGYDTGDVYTEYQPSSRSGKTLILH
eukprot:UN00436